MDTPSCRHLADGERQLLQHDGCCGGAGSRGGGFTALRWGFGPKLERVEAAGWGSKGVAWAERLEGSHWGPRAGGCVSSIGCPLWPWKRPTGARASPSLGFPLGAHEGCSGAAPGLSTALDIPCTEHM